jgi:nitrogen regulatory protein PII
MEIVLLIETKNFQKVKDMLLKDDLVSRASIIFKEAKNYGGKEGYYSYVSGSKEQCKKALELTKDLAEEVKNKEKDNVISKIKEESEKANEAFGGIFG